MSEINSHRIAPILGPVLALLLLAPGLRAQEEAASPRTSLEAFAALHARVAAAEEEGRLPADAAAAAEELAFDLKTELIRRDAEIEVLKLEAARFDGERQRQALDRLVAAAAARERRVIDHLRRLEALSGMPATGVPAAGVAGETAEPAGGDDRPKGKKAKLNLTFEAEDLIEDPDP